MYTQQAVKCPQVALLEQGFKAIIYTLINIVAKIIEGGGKLAFGGGGDFPGFSPTLYETLPSIYTV